MKADRPAPPMARNFVDGLGYIVNRDILLAEVCKTTWGKVQKIWGGETKFLNILTRCSM